MERLEKKYENTNGGYQVENIDAFKPIIDPSGFVYEAVLSNTIEDAEVSVWQKQTLYDQYDEPYEEITLWNAEDYGQTNPQRTEADGVFAWDVPDGLWQVRVSKFGYEDAASDWLTVPPIHKDIHIGMVNLTAPSVDSISLGGDAVVLTFDKYMEVSTLKKSIRLSVNGTDIEGSMSFPDAEADPYDGTKLYARTAKISFTSSLVVGDTVLLTVTSDAKSYAGTTLETEYKYEEKIEDVSSLEVIATELDKGREAYITVIALPSSAANGRIVTVSGDLEELGIAMNTEITLNSFGRGSLPVCASVCGTFNLHFALMESDLTVDAVITIIDKKTYTLVSDSVILATDIGFANRAELRFCEENVSVADMIWTSDHPEIVRVEDGILIAVGGGTATVTGTKDGKEVRCAVRVLENAKGLLLPSMLREIEEEAFSGNNSFEYAQLPQTLQEIGNGAFADDESLQLIYIPDSVNVFGVDIFSGSYQVTVFVSAGSEAETYCRKNSVPFQYVVQ